MPRKTESTPKAKKKTTKKRAAPQTRKCAAERKADELLDTSHDVSKDQAERSNYEHTPGATARNSTPETKARQRGRSKDVETHDNETHPVDQAWQEWGYERWLSRPTGRCELTPRGHRKLTRELCVDICRMLGEGLYQYHVEGLLGLSDRSIVNWCARAKIREAKIAKWCKSAKLFDTHAAAVRKLGAKPMRNIYMDLKLMVRKAEAIGETTLFGALIRYALDGDAKTAQWILERKYPKRYGKYALRGENDEDSETAGKPMNPIRELARALETAHDRAEDGA
jgi:hypothetical protein